MDLYLEYWQNTGMSLFSCYVFWSLLLFNSGHLPNLGRSPCGLAELSSLHSQWKLQSWFSLIYQKEMRGGEEISKWNPSIHNLLPSLMNVLKCTRGKQREKLSLNSVCSQHSQKGENSTFSISTWTPQKYTGKSWAVLWGILSVPYFSVLKHISICPMSYSSR